MKKLLLGVAVLSVAIVSVAAQAGNKLYAENNLQKGQFIQSNSTFYSLVMQNDGNLVVYSNRGAGARAIWSAGSTGWYARMQIDGNLVVYNQNGTWNYTSGTGNRPYDPNAYLQLNDDGSLEMHHGNSIIWTTARDAYANTPPACPPGSPTTLYPVKSYTSLGQCFQSTIPANCPAEAQWTARQTGQVVGTCP